MEIKIPRVGIGVLVGQNGRLLLGKRKGAHGKQTWSLPGGHLEFGETPEECAKRELLEETNLTALNCRIGPWTNDFFINENKHYVTIFCMVSLFEGEVCLKEPDKCEGWNWFAFKELPAPLFLPLENLLRSHSIPSLFMHNSGFNP